MISKVVLGVLAAAALGCAVAIWISDGNGGQTIATTNTSKSTTRTITRSGTVIVTTKPGAVTVTTTPGHPPRSAELTLVVLFLGAFLVFGLAAVSRGPITSLTFPGGGGFGLGAAAQAQVSGAIAERYTEPAQAQAAYTQAIGLLHELNGDTKVETLPPATVDEVLRAVTQRIPPQTVNYDRLRDPDLSPPREPDLSPPREPDLSPPRAPDLSPPRAPDSEPDPPTPDSPVRRS
jgi:hypothetical protein